MFWREYILPYHFYFEFVLVLLFASSLFQFFVVVAVVLFYLCNRVKYDKYMRIYLCCFEMFEPSYYSSVCNMEEQKKCKMCVCVSVCMCENTMQ